MLLRQRETGMVLEQVEVANVARTHIDGVLRHFDRVCGIVKERGTSRFPIGEVFYWPYLPEDWEEVDE